MSLYSLVHGEAPHADALLAALGLTRRDVGRFRDCFIANGEIVVFTRNGGGNRRSHKEVFDALRAHPCYLRDQDHDFDDTYAAIYFSFPEAHKEALASLDFVEQFDPLANWIEESESKNES